MAFLKNLFVKTPKTIKTGVHCPAIFIPGSSAGKNRFDLTFKMMNINPKNVLKLVVNSNKVISTTGVFKGYVVIAFENNRDGYENIKEQARLLDAAFAYLVSRFDFEEFNAVGHSNGGLNWTIFLEKYFGNYDKTILNLVTIGTPFNLDRKDGKKTPMLIDLIRKKNSIPRNLKVHAIAGLDDGIVANRSAWASKDIFYKTVADFTELNVSGLTSYHSALPQNQLIVDSLTSILRIPQ